MQLLIPSCPDERKATETSSPHHHAFHLLHHKHHLTITTSIAATAAAHRAPQEGAAAPEAVFAVPPGGADSLLRFGPAARHHLPSKCRTKSCRARRWKGTAELVLNLTPRKKHPVVDPKRQAIRVECTWREAAEKEHGSRGALTHLCQQSPLSVPLSDLNCSVRP
ncbi:hypothetical protein O3P69_013174 [Scylla paramamosain]|uniref:Uncharacterized protein n=1 Tax=Scylla paramamosain TaxID=85552 RepID=A0AAW0U215_SCYPA